VHDDNPYSEALFRTLKYRPGFPRGAFESLEAAREWVAGFVRWYNSEHFHSSIQFVTPDQRHFGLDRKILEKRQRVYEAARQKHPERWTRGVRDWSPIDDVYLNPMRNAS
jgi:transposase InsO family protein